MNDTILRLAHRKTLVIVLTGLASLLLSVLSLRFNGIPVPYIHDEFAYLLAGDTFAHGRLTNPSHPLGEHFETFHVFQEPTYQAKYPPGQGAFLAVGQKLGHPIVGVWISLALACGAVLWMLQGVFPPGWALLGGLIVALNPNMSHWWGSTYWGGAVAMLGGALFFGALFRLSRQRSLRLSVVMGIGILILANSRPFEGFITCLLALPYFLVTAVILPWRRGERKEVVLEVITPLAIALLLLAAWVLYYDYRLTGDMLKFYYSNWNAKSSAIELVRGYRGSIHLTMPRKYMRLWRFFVGPVLSFAALGLWVVFRRRDMLFALVVVTALSLISTRWTPGWPHYIAPVTCLIYALCLQGFAGISRLGLAGRRWGMVLAAGVAVAYFANSAYLTVEKLQFGERRRWAHIRADIESWLAARGRKHLVLVRYGEEHRRSREWVYNGARIDSRKVVWARDLGPAKNRRLLEYYPGRNVWLLLADRNPPHIAPYEPPPRSPATPGLSAGTDGTTGESPD